jgi:hypothetical protein
MWICNKLATSSAVSKESISSASGSRIPSSKCSVAGRSISDYPFFVNKILPYWVPKLAPRYSLVKFCKEGNDELVIGRRSTDVHKKGTVLG